VKEYCNLLRNANLDPIDIMKDADTNRDGVIDLKEFEKALKQYVKPNQLPFENLQHILDSFDINNDGKVTSKEYEAAVKKYGAPDVDDPDVTRDEIVYAAKDASKNSGLTLKKAIATCDFNENNAIPIQTLNRNIRNKIGYDHQQANELINLIREGEEPEITAEEIFTFYDEKLADDPNIDLEIKIILNRIEIEQSESIIKYLVRECGFEADKDLLLKLF
jgi:Ca2+-binding EF-hand superfamily protein